MMTGVHIEGGARTPTELIGQAVIMNVDYGFLDFYNRLRSFLVTIERSDFEVDRSSLMCTYHEPGPKATDVQGGSARAC